MAMEEFIHWICSRLGEKVRLLDSFARATAKIKDGIEAEEPRQISRHVKERQTIINRIESIDRELDGLRRENSISVGTLSKRAEDLIGDYLVRIRVSLESVAEMDRECLVSAQDEYSSMRSGILQIRSGLRIARGYGRTGTKAPKFLDLKR
jgi:hypothetical protein